MRLPETILREPLLGEADVSPAPVAESEPAEAAEPRQHPLRQPAVPTPALAAVHPASGDPGLDPALTQIELDGIDRAGTNFIEAQAVVDAAVRHMREHLEVPPGLCTTNVL